MLIINVSQNFYHHIDSYIYVHKNALSRRCRRLMIIIIILSTSHKNVTAVVIRDNL